MFKVRTLLVLFSSFFASVSYYAGSASLALFQAEKTSRLESLYFVVSALAGLAVIAGLTVFALTFAGAKVEAGRLCFNPDNIIHKLTLANLKGGSSLCGTTWGVFWVIFGAVFVVAIAFGAVAFVIKLASDGQLLKIAGLLAGLLLACGVVVFLISLTPKFIQKIMVGICLAALAVFAVVAFVVLPIKEIAKQNALPVSGAVPIYLSYVYLGLVGIALIVGVVWAAFKFLPGLKNTWLGKLVAGLCPVVITCPVNAPCPEPAGA